MELPKLNLPAYSFTLTKKSEQVYITCVIRKKEILLTPEEWVRQNFIWYLISEKKFPKNLIAVEKQLEVNGLKKRFDILCYTQKGNPVLLVECKAPSIKLDKNTFKQIANYNQALAVPYLVVTNGLQHIPAKLDFISKEVVFLKEILDYEKVKL